METTETTPEIAKDNILICKKTEPLKGNTIAPPLTLDQEYPALQVITCGCGKKHIDVGLKSEYNFVSCHACNEILPQTEVHWCHPGRFEIKK